MGYILLVLTAMQVALSTDMLRESAAFQAASSGFTLFAILAASCRLGASLGRHCPSGALQCALHVKY